MNCPDNDHLQQTPMLDYDHTSLQALIKAKRWGELSPYDAVGAIYTFVRDDIRFGYNIDDTIPASQVLKDGYGQCNTKGTLLMALLRGVGISNRFHGFTIYNELQRGAIPGYLFALAPERIVHSWVEVYLDARWINLEGYIIDRAYLGQVQARFGDECKTFSGYGVATPCLAQPPIDWHGENTYIQNEGIADDFGVYARPDDFYPTHRNLAGVRKWLFRYLFRHLMNRNVDRIRRRGISSRARKPLRKSGNANSSARDCKS